MIDTSGNKLYEYLTKDLDTLSRTDLENLLDEAINRHSGHPTGSTSEAQTKSLILRLENEKKKRDEEISKKESKENLIVTLQSNRLNRWILLFTVIAAILSFITLLATFLDKVK